MKRLLAGIALLVAAIASAAYQQHYARETNSQQSKEDCISLAFSTEEKHSCEQQAQARKDYSKWWHILVTWPEGITTWAVIATFFVIGWQSYETRRSAKATENSVEAGRDTAIKQLRAYVGVKRARLFVYEDGSVEAKVELFNCGQTPAYGLYGVQNTGFRSYPIARPKPPQPSALKPVSTGILGGGDSYHLNGKLTPYVLGKEQLLIDLQAPDFAYGLIGWYSYRDIFKEKREVEFQLVVGGGTPLSRGRDSTGEWLVLFNDSEGNEST